MAAVVGSEGSLGWERMQRACDAGRMLALHGDGRCKQGAPGTTITCSATGLQPSLSAACAPSPLQQNQNTLLC